MTKVFFSVAMSLDGFIGPVDPDREKWMEQWMKLQGWQSEQRFFRENLHIGEGGETGVDNDVLEETFKRTGATILGKRMFDGGETGWPEEAPFHTPVFVVTHQEREPWERPGGTTFYFVNDGIESALKQALEVADGRDIRIGGGGQTLIQYLNAGLVDEFTVTLVPVLLGEGIRLFERLDTGRIDLVGEEAMHSPRVTHLRYTVGSR